MHDNPWTLMPPRGALTSPDSPRLFGGCPGQGIYSKTLNFNLGLQKYSKFQWFLKKNLVMSCGGSKLSLSKNFPAVVQTSFSREFHKNYYKTCG